MGYILEETQHPTLTGTEIWVDEKIKGETRNAWNIVTLHVDTFKIRTPSDMIELGEWLIQNAKRIKREYTPTGKLK